MIDKVTIDFSVQQVKYHLDIDSKITIIKGCSGIGKTYFVDQLDVYERFVANESDDRIDSDHIGFNVDDIDNQSLKVSNGYTIIVLPETFPFIPPKYNVLEGLSNSEKKKRNKYYADMMFDALYAIIASRNVTDPSKVIFVTDEKSIYVDTHYFQRTVKAMPSLFIFINRDPFLSALHECSCVKTLELRGGTNILIPYEDVGLSTGIRGCALECATDLFV